MFHEFFVFYCVKVKYHVVIWNFLTVEREKFVIVNIFKENATYVRALEITGRVTGFGKKFDSSLFKIFHFIHFVDACHSCIGSLWPL